MKTKFYNIPAEDKTQARREALGYYVAMQPALLARAFSSFPDFECKLIPARPGSEGNPSQRPYVLLKFTSEEALAVYLNPQRQVDHLYFLLSTKRRKSGMVAFFTPVRLKWSRDIAAKILSCPEAAAEVAACVEMERQAAAIGSGAEGQGGEPQSLAIGA